MKVKLLNNIPQTGLTPLAERGYNVSDAEEAPDAIIVRSAAMHEMSFNSELLCIARAGAGTNNIPVNRCAEEGIVVFNTPGANAEAVKELVVCAMLMSSRDVLGGIDWVRSAADGTDAIVADVEKEKARFVGPELGGKALGVLGLGAVGTRIANIALHLGMTVYGYDPYISLDSAWNLSPGVIHANDLDTIYKNCDYITIHVPYIKDQTHHMINSEAIAKMRDGVRVINLARAELVCDDDILAALASGKVTRYVTDFPNAKTANAPGVIALPHLGASTPESEDNCAAMAAAEIIEYLENGNIVNSVNFPNVSLPRAGESRLCVINRNVPGVVQAVLECLGNRSANIENITTKPGGDFAYTVIDTTEKFGADLVGEVEALENVVRVRLL